MDREEVEPTVRSGISDEGKTIVITPVKTSTRLAGLPSSACLAFLHKLRSIAHCNLTMGIEFAPLVAWPIHTMAAAVTSWRDEGCSPIDRNDSYRRVTGTRTRRSRSSRRTYLDIEQEQSTPPIPRVISFHDGLPQSKLMPLRTKTTSLSSASLEIFEQSLIEPPWFLSSPSMLYDPSIR
jgi:hypothetical protein